DDGRTPRWRGVAAPDRLLDLPAKAAVPRRHHVDVTRMPGDSEGAGVARLGGARAKREGERDARQVLELLLHLVARRRARAKRAVLPPEQVQHEALYAERRRCKQREQDSERDHARDQPWPPHLRLDSAMNDVVPVTDRIERRYELLQRLGDRVEG